MKSDAFNGPFAAVIAFQDGRRLRIEVSQSEIDNNDRDQFLSLLEARIENARRDAVTWMANGIEHG